MQYINLTRADQAIFINHSDFSLLVSLRGGQVLQWQPKQQSAVFWHSDLAQVQPNQAIRGGIPLCWPWFGRHVKDATAPNHGIARQALWRLTELKQNTEQVVLMLSLTEQASQSAVVNYPFQLTQTLRVTKQQLQQQLTMQHSASEPQAISLAFHNYFAVQALSKVQLSGLQQQSYFCKYTEQLKQFEQSHIEPPMDAIFEQYQAVTLVDPLAQRTMEISAVNCGQIVVWNPGFHAEQIADVGLMEQPRFICIEPAIVKPILLAPNVSYQVSQNIAITAM